jgi:hypothetical protein
VEVVEQAVATQPQVLPMLVVPVVEVGVELIVKAPI